MRNRRKLTMNQYERHLWQAANALYERFRVSCDMETSRECLVTHLRLMADEIEDRSRAPNGDEADTSLIEE